VVALQPLECPEAEPTVRTSLEFRFFESFVKKSSCTSYINTCLSAEPCSVASVLVCSQCFSLWVCFASSLFLVLASCALLDCNATPGRCVALTIEWGTESELRE
jgi:hypothetical protein